VDVLESGSTSRGSVDLASLADQARDRLLAEDVATSPCVELDLDPVAREVSVLEEHARVIVDNLVESAVEYGRDRKPQVRVSTKRTSDAWIELTIEERLDPIPAALQQRIIQELGRGWDELPFEFTGLAVRMALVTETVRRIGGKLEVHPAPEEGLLLTVTLPAAAGTGPAQDSD
jgi:signal transduction histidine kinase